MFKIGLITEQFRRINCFQPLQLALSMTVTFQRLPQWRLSLVASAIDLSICELPRQVANEGTGRNAGNKNL
jgi:hypothetical protein